MSQIKARKILAREELITALRKQNHFANECWIWRGRRTKNGYGQIIIEGTHFFVHRLSFEFHKGKIPPGFEVMHDCPGKDNPLCCNPRHLFLGTRAENRQDRSRKETS